MAIYVANTSGPWDVLSTWLTSSATMDVITPTASGWAVATVLPTMQDDVYLNNKTVVLQTASFIHTARSITNKPLNGSSIGNSTPITIAGGSSTTLGFLSTSTGSKTYYISCSYIDGGNSSTPQTLFISGSTTTTRTLVYVTGNLIHNQDSNTTGLVTMPGNSSSIYVVGNVVGGGNLACINSAGNYNYIEVTGSVYGGGTGTTVTTRYHGITATGLYFSCSISGSVYGDRGPALHMNNSTGSWTQIIGDVYASSQFFAISASLNTGSRPHNVYIYGSVINDATTGQTALTGTRFFVSGAYVNGTTTNVRVKYQPRNAVLSMLDKNVTSDPTPATYNVYAGISYGNGKIGSLSASNTIHVRSGISYSSGSVGSTPITVYGTCYIPGTESVRRNTVYDSASFKRGNMAIPGNFEVKFGAFLDFGNQTGSYQSASQYWSTSSNSFTQVSSSGYLLSRSLDVPLGSISRSFVSDLNNVNATSNTIRRMQTVHTTESILQIGSYL
jgi:hypothetical protein